LMSLMSALKLRISQMLAIFGDEIDIYNA
jgi:hypothetical protein